MVSACLSGSHRENASRTKTGANSTPRSAAQPATIMRIPRTAPANRPASSSRPSSRNSEYTGITEALSVPSPKRFWITLGILVAAIHASINPDAPKNDAISTLLISPLTRLKKMPAPTVKAARERRVSPEEGWEGSLLTALVTGREHL